MSLMLSNQSDGLQTSEEVERLGELYGAWWIDFLGEHCHVGSEEATRWLLARAKRNGGRALDAGAFVGATARLLASSGFRAVATDAVPEFLAAGQRMPGGRDVSWVAAPTQRLPFADGTFSAVWCLDADIAPREFSRVAAPQSELFLCTETPEEGRGGAESFLGEWAAYGWRLRAHKSVTREAIATWQKAEMQLVGRRTLYEPRYGKRPYLMQLDLVAELVRSYSMHELGHGLFILERDLGSD